MFDLRPLAFGAAWKVLDLLQELAFSQAGLGGAPGAWRALRAKVDRAKRTAGLSPPLTYDARAVACAHGRLRSNGGHSEHSLVHRASRGRPDDGRVHWSRRPGQRTSFDHRGLPTSVLQGGSTCGAGDPEQTMSARERADLAWNLDQLGGLHGQLTLGGQPMEMVPLGIASTPFSGNDILVDAQALLSELRQTS